MAELKQEVESCVKQAEKQYKAADRRLRRAYGISLEEYGIMLDEQGNVCKICGNPPTDRRLHVDHDHKFKYFKVSANKTQQGWFASTREEDVAKGLVPAVFGIGPTKSVAIRDVRNQLKRLSIRGIICWPCNRSLRSFNNNPVAMEQAAKYIREFQSQF